MHPLASPRLACESLEASRIAVSFVVSSISFAIREEGNLKLISIVCYRQSNPSIDREVRPVLQF
ncbi:hypothetical protein GW17_00034885 [Ensete ventricosum]|nr:hypothetical protein GW17_00034885 [Ensete ventricosum]